MLGEGEEGELEVGGDHLVDPERGGGEHGLPGLGLCGRLGVVVVPQPAGHQVEVLVGQPEGVLVPEQVEALRLLLVLHQPAHLHVLLLRTTLANGFALALEVGKDLLVDVLQR